MPTIARALIAEPLAISKRLREQALEIGGTARARVGLVAHVGAGDGDEPRQLFARHTDVAEPVPARFYELAHAAGVAGGGAAFVPWLRRLKETIGIAPRLGAAGVTREQVPRLVAIATADMCHQTNPRPCSAADFERLFVAAL
jgi:hypothetical protein